MSHEDLHEQAHSLALDTVEDLMSGPSVGVYVMLVYRDPEGNLFARCHLGVRSDKGRDALIEQLRRSLVALERGDFEVEHKGVTAAGGEA